MKSLTLLLVLAVTACSAPLHAQATREPALPVNAAILQGEQPPGMAMKLSPAEARKLLEQTIQKKYVGEWSQCMLLICAKAQLEPASEVRVRMNGFEMSAPYVWTGGLKGEDRIPVKVSFVRAPDYLVVVKMPIMRTPKPLYVVGFQRVKKTDASLHLMKLLWTNEALAQQFADAFNRLVYHSHHGGPNSAEGFLLFASAAKTWRETPQKPPLPEAADRERILAENSIREKDLNAAIEHYEAGLAISPLWPEAWFNSALIYGELQDYASAANSMKHYLELVPNAPDAAAAREKLIIWEDKARTTTGAVQ
ncbi:MAG TPA: tetratricopeptide repeat protein [Terriglobales bacterium]|nr:tetratricopeptide repeat protein [Terriglobales bacterium]